jgi:drug/metabolite transporter (DMT)-like permease
MTQAQATTAAGADTDAQRRARGYAFGLLGVAIFALTLPMTRLAVGDAAAPQLPPSFVTAGRAAVAGLLSIAYLRWVGAAWPPRRLWRALAACAVGTVLGFPLFLALALRHVDAMHAAVITGVLPLGTAVAAALLMRQRASVAFWACAVAGCALVLAFAALQGGGRLAPADGLLLLAVASASIGYVYGARVTAAMPAEHVICWVLVMSLPLTLPAALLTWPADAAASAASAWMGFAYVTLFSMWLGFFPLDPGARAPSAHEPVGHPRDPQGDREARHHQLAGGLPSPTPSRWRRCCEAARARAGNTRRAGPAVRRQRRLRAPARLGGAHD